MSHCLWEGEWEEIGATLWELGGNGNEVLKLWHCENGNESNARSWSVGLSVCPTCRCCRHVRLLCLAVQFFLFYAVDYSWSVATENYCYTLLSCDGDKIETLSGEMLMTKDYCCDNVAGVSWGGQGLGQCEPCSKTTSGTTSLYSHASSKCSVRLCLIKHVAASSTITWTRIDC